MIADIEGVIAVAGRLVVDVSVVSAAAWLIASFFATSEPGVRRRIWIGAMVALWGVVLRAVFAIVLPTSAEAPIDGRFLIESRGALQMIVWVLLAVAAVSVLRLARVLIAVARLARLGSRAPHLDDAWTGNASSVDDMSGRAPRLVVGPVGSAVSCWGIVTSTIMLPVSALQWPADHVRLVILHEREHLRRHDPQFHFLAEVLRALLWFHPGVTHVVRRLAQERELACDRATVERGVDPLSYAEALLFVAQWSPRNLPLATGAIGETRLAVRLDALIGPPAPMPALSATLRHAALTIGLIVVVAWLLASPPLVAFEAGEGWGSSSVDGASGSHPGSFRPHAPPSS